MTDIDAQRGRLISSEEALALLDSLSAAGRDVYGVEGFRLLPDEQRQADLDLIFDVSANMKHCTHAEHCAFVRIFVANRAGPDIHWEVDFPQSH
jgi:hypothetical protein